MLTEYPGEASYIIMYTIDRVRQYLHLAFNFSNFILYTYVMLWFGVTYIYAICTRGPGISRYSFPTCNSLKVATKMII